MRALFIVAGCVWLGVALLFVLAIACAAARAMPRSPGLTNRRGPARAPRRSLEDRALLPDEAPVAGTVIDA